MTRFKLGNIVHDKSRPHLSGELFSLGAVTSRYRVDGVVVVCPTTRLRLGRYRLPPVKYKYPQEVREAAARFGLTARQYLACVK